MNEQQVFFGGVIITIMSLFLWFMKMWFRNYIISKVIKKIGNNNEKQQRKN